MDGAVFARSGTKKFNEWFGGTIRTVGRECDEIMGDNLVALVLGGSYGAGEGAVVKGDSDDMPYHDIDLYPVILKEDPGSFKRFRTAVRKYEDRFQAFLDVKTPLRERDIAKLRPELKYWDLLHGYVVVSGDETILERNLPKWFHAVLPKQEGSRLLLLHGISLLECQRVLKGIAAEPDPEFVRRSYWKCVYALGDALLISHGRYTAGSDAKLKNLGELLSAREDLSALDMIASYEKAIEFRLKPGSFPKKRPELKDIEDLTWKWGTVFLQAEKKRLEGNWKNLEEYCSFEGRRESNLFGLKGLARNVLFSVQNGSFSFSHPREIAYIRLPVLLGLTTVRPQGADWTTASERIISFMARWK